MTVNSHERALGCPPLRLLRMVAPLLAVTFSPAQGEAAAVELPEPTGPHVVGTRLVHWVDTTRSEIGTGNSSDRRELMVQLWYPTERRDGDPAPYVPQAEIFREHEIFDDEDIALVNSVRHHAIADASVAQSGAPYPVVVFSTGNGEMLFMYTALMEELASHGYVVAEISHPGLAHVAYPDGRVLKRYPRLYDPKPEGWDEQLSEESLIALRRAVYDGYYDESSEYLRADVSFVIDKLEALAQGEGEDGFEGKLALDKIATWGHSHGGNVAVEACARDARVKACLNMDGSAFGRTRENGLRRPFMLFRPAFINDGWPRGLSQEQILGSIKADAFEVNIVGAEHRSFMDSRFLFPRTQQSSARPRRVLHITSQYGRAFLGKYLSGHASRLLDGPSPEFSDVLLKTVDFHFPQGDYVELKASHTR